MFFKKNKLTVEEQMLNYMKEKYQEDFTPGLCEEANWAYSYDSMTVYSHKFPGEFIDVYRYEKKIFKDNYIGFLFREEIENIIHNIAEPLFGRCVVIMHVSNFPLDKDLKKDTTLEEYLKNACPLNNVSIYIQEYNPLKNYRACLEELRLKFKKQLLPYDLSFLFLKPDKSLNDINRKTEDKILDNLGEDTWFTKEVFICFLDNYELRKDDLEQL